MNEQDIFAEALRQQLPGLKTKAQLTAFMASFEAYRAMMNAILEANQEHEAQAQEALILSFEVLRKATHISNVLRDTPEAATSKASDDFREEPAAFGEYDTQRKLFSELEGIRSSQNLNDWYKTNRRRIDEVTTASLRNPLLDAIRERKNILVEEEKKKTVDGP